MSVVNYRFYLLYAGCQRRGGGHARHGTGEGRASKCSPPPDFYLLLRCPKS